MKSIPYIFKKKRNIIFMKIIDYLGHMFFKSRPVISLARKILIIRTAHIGDVLFTTPMLASLRRAYPQAQIDYLCGDWAVDIIRNNPNIDNIIVYNAFWLDRKRRNKLNLRTICNLRSQKYDLIIQCGFEYKDNILARSINAKNIIGYSICGFGFLLDKSASYVKDKIHDKDLHLKLLEAIGIKPEIKETQVYLSRTEEHKAFQLLEQFDLMDYIAIAPGVGDKVRQWPIDSWSHLLALLLKKAKKVVILGSSQESLVVSEILSSFFKDNEQRLKNIINLTGTLTLMETTAVIKQAKAIIGLESSLIHIANALSIKSIAIFSGFTDTKRWAINDSITTTLKHECKDARKCNPYQCTHRDCLAAIKPEDVFKVLLEKLEGNKPKC